MTALLSQQDQRRKGEWEKQKWEKHWNSKRQKLKKIQKRKKAGFLLEEKEMSPRELDPTHTNSAILNKEREFLIVSTQHLNILMNKWLAWLLQL